MAHFFNYHFISRLKLSEWQQVQPSAAKVPSPFDLMWRTISGTTGEAALVCLLLIYSTSFERMRRTYFELFWYTHHLMVAFYALIIVHG